jgi:Tfp pilus assembly protein FimT
MMVMALVTLVSAIGLVNLSRLQNVFRLRSSADEIKAQIQYGRELAIGNKDRAIYNVNLSGTIFRLQADGKEISRFQIPAGVALTPASINWNFTPITGELTACSSCQIVLVAGEATETINIQANGIVD